MAKEELSERQARRSAEYRRWLDIVLDTDVVSLYRAGRLPAGFAEHDGLILLAA